MNSVAFLGWSDGRILLGEGPFEARAEAPREGVAFFLNDFGLAGGEPWRVPARWRLVEREEALAVLGPAEPLAVTWEVPEAGPFAEVFQEISVSIRAGLFEKTVPVVVEHGVRQVGSCAALFRAAMARTERLVPYGFGDERSGFAGLSPEYLLRLEGRRLRTMALAGTARVEEREVLAVDEKEIREHEFVAQALASKLGELGRLKRGEREILDLGPIVHFHTPIEVELEREESVDRLVGRLHPTPALGPLPRTEETMGKLLEWRRRLGSPPEFGAPFGAMLDGEFRSIVAIRGIWWQGDRLRLPAGCGVIEASRLVNEWRELRLKRDAVRARFGL